MVLLKIHCLSKGKLSRSRCYNVELFSFQEIDVESATKIETYVNSNSFYGLRGWDETGELKAEIISDVEAIKVIKNLFNFNIKYSNSDYDIIMEIRNQISSNYYINFLHVLIYMGYTDLNHKLHIFLDESTYPQDYNYSKPNDYNLFEEKLSNVMSVLSLQKFIGIKGNCEQGIFRIIRTYFDTNGYDYFLEEIVPELY